MHISKPNVLIQADDRNISELGLLSKDRSVCCAGNIHALSSCRRSTVGARSINGMLAIMYQVHSWLLDQP